MAFCLSLFLLLCRECLLGCECHAILDRRPVFRDLRVLSIPHTVENSWMVFVCSSVTEVWIDGKVQSFSEQKFTFKLICEYVMSLLVAVGCGGEEEATSSHLSTSLRSSETHLKFRFCRRRHDIVAAPWECLDRWYGIIYKHSTNTACSRTLIILYSVRRVRFNLVRSSSTHMFGTKQHE